MAWTTTAWSQKTWIHLDLVPEGYVKRPVTIVDDGSEGSLLSGVNALIMETNLAVWNTA